VDVLAAHRVFKSGIKNFVAMPTSTQKMLPINYTQLEEHGKPSTAMGQALFDMTWNQEKCLGTAPMRYWDQSAAALMVLLKAQGLLEEPWRSSGTFCKEFTTYSDSIYLYNGGELGQMRLDETYGTKIHACSKADSAEWISYYWKTVIEGKPNCPPVDKLTQPGWWRNARKMLTGDDNIKMRMELPALMRAKHMK
jgi:hypothetical protein